MLMDTPLYDDDSSLFTSSSLNDNLQLSDNNEYTFPSLDDLSEFDKGHFTMKLLNDTNDINGQFYSIKPEHLQSKMFAQMLMYRQKNLFTDVTLRIKDRTIHAHKLVLSAGSTYFASMFDNSLIESRLDEINLTKTISCPLTLDLIINFIYSSKIILNDKNVLALLTCSSCLQIDALLDICISYLGDHLHTSNCIGLLLFGKHYQCKQLEIIAQNYIYNHFEDVVRNEEFLNLTAIDLHNVIKNDELKVSCESIIYSVRF
ncbi:unnamed protein product [Didymodactylos carnosus]|uniref:BTB domain-containing protein n=1 Tax=Didymodactylos carnosus TaxID=1234261 RepID=A0A816AIR3_9BILA|nr:unnamed protein product [Didymodactylos carnosus]CAF4474003.1 unnamed protein product [Didymodactylos carnosus]